MNWATLDGLSEMLEASCGIEVPNFGRGEAPPKPELDKEGRS